MLNSERSRVYRQGSRNYLDFTMQVVVPVTSKLGDNTNPLVFY